MGFGRSGGFLFSSFGQIMRRKQARLQSREARESVGVSMFGDTSNKDEDFMKTKEQPC